MQIFEGECFIWDIRCDNNYVGQCRKYNKQIRKPILFKMIYTNKKFQQAKKCLYPVHNMIFHMRNNHLTIKYVGQYNGRHVGQLIYCRNQYHNNQNNLWVMD